MQINGDDEKKNRAGYISREAEDIGTGDVPAGFYQKMQFLDTFDLAVILRSAPRTSQPLEGRQAVRQFYIRQKRMVIMDSKALNEVCREFGRADYRFNC